MKFIILGKNDKCLLRLLEIELKLDKSELEYFEELNQETKDIKDVSIKELAKILKTSQIALKRFIYDYRNGGY